MTKYLYLGSFDITKSSDKFIAINLLLSEFGFILFLIPWLS